MALTELELYEALRKDISEESARMIAEAFSRSNDLVTRTVLEEAFERSEERMKVYVDSRIQTSEERLKAYVDSRILRYTAIILVPVGLTMIGTVGALIALVAQL